MSDAPALTDTHAHLTHHDYRGDPEVVARAAARGVARIITVGFDFPTSDAAAALAASDDRVWHSPGIHPHDAAKVNSAAIERLRRLAQSPRAVAMGETGLDFYRDRSPRDAQVEAFRAHLRLATECDLPVIVHSRDAHAEVLRVWEQSDCRRGVMHCFSGDAQIARQAIDLELYIGIAGPVTFHNAERLRAIVSDLPRDRVLLETDCPYLAPHPHRGQPNEPAYLPLIAEAVANCWDMTMAEAASITMENAARCFPRLDG